MTPLPLKQRLHDEGRGVGVTGGYSNSLFPGVGSQSCPHFSGIVATLPHSLLGCVFIVLYC